MSAYVGTVKFRRGLAVNRPTFAVGEPGLDTNAGTPKVWVGTTDGNKEIALVDNVPTLSAQSPVPRKYVIVPTGDGMQISAGNSFGNSLQVVCAPFNLHYPITVGSVAVNVTALQTSSIDICIFSWDKATRYIQTGWQSLAANANVFTLAASVALTPASLIVAVSIKRTGGSPSLAYAYANQTVDGIAYLINAGTSVLGLNSVDANATTGIPSTLGTITPGPANAIPLVKLISA